MRISLIIIFLLSISGIHAQYEWQWEELSPMPMAISNNAVTSAEAFGTTFIYSFGGIDSTKIWSGINNSSFRYDTSSDVWESIGDIDNDTPVIAAGASTVNGMIYIIGGYTVAPNGSETSINDVHIFNPMINDYIEPGAPIPVPIDDQVQCVYNDSLIFIVTGWSNNGNVNNVQIYDTYNDSWQAGTAVPNTNDYRVFGGSGEIIGDTLYYIGGARSGTNFPLTSVIRKGYIDPADPTSITWSAETMVEDALGYRMAVARWEDRIFWFGGSTTSYNYNGIAYNGSGGVDAESRIIQYSSDVGLEIIADVIPALMDFRGIGRLGDDTFYLAGGMLAGQVVSDKLFKLSYIDTTTTTSAYTYHTQVERIHIYPNPAADYIYLEHHALPNSASLIAADGRRYSLSIEGSSLALPENIANGLYILKVNDVSIKLSILK